MAVALFVSEIYTFIQTDIGILTSLLMLIYNLCIY